MRPANARPALPHHPVPGLRDIVTAFIRTDMGFAVALYCCAGYPCQLGPLVRWFSHCDYRSRRHWDRQPARPAAAPAPANGHAAAPRCHSGATIGNKGRPRTRQAKHAADRARHTRRAAHRGCRSRLRARAHCTGGYPLWRPPFLAPGAAILLVSNHSGRRVESSDHLAQYRLLCG